MFTRSPSQMDGIADEHRPFALCLQYYFKESGIGKPLAIRQVHRNPPPTAPTGSWDGGEASSARRFRNESTSSTCRRRFADLLRPTGGRHHQFIGLWDPERCGIRIVNWDVIILSDFEGFSFRALTGRCTTCIIRI